MTTIPQKLADEALGWVLIGGLTVPERRAEVVAWTDGWLTALEQEQWPPPLGTLSSGACLLRKSTRPIL